jgi:hypothetical protein
MILRLAEITVEQALQLNGVVFFGEAKFNPIEIEGKWYISENEVTFCDNSLFTWVNELEVIEVEIQLVPSIHEQP